jgi:tRNA A-37 threonylcarbamoyl transferase component Bud32/tetratricopeptide (TPR) repeat protein
VNQELRDQLQATLSGTHTLERELGGGGMSKVFVAEETRLGRKVVVKVLSPELAQGLSIERFEREIRTAAALQQANIVPVLSAGDTNGLPFYTMPFVTGESLRARLGRGPLPVNEVVSEMRDVARALAYAHRQGVVHRDIKPDNVLLSEGAAVVTDFGIAKAISAARTSGAGATLTQIGTSIGTPAYMAPEQAAGDPDIDHRADIYSLGAMAYELLTGQAVFANRSPQRMLAAHMGETPVPVAQLRPDAPLQLGDLVMACLAKDPTERPQDASQILLGLDTTGGGSMASMPAVLLGGPGMFRKALVIYAVAFIAVAILARAAIVGIGLPGWVFQGALIVMALGLPVVLWTGYVQHVTRRALIMTPTFTPGGTPSVAGGTIATMALKAAPHVSWYRTARGGLYALGAFTVMVAAFMGMRAWGIGPFGSLLARGALNARDRVMITDFTVSGGDSTLGRVVSDAVRAGLSESSVLTLVSQGEVAAALERMQRPGSSRIDLETARQIAQREGIKAIIDGDVASLAGSYILAVRLVTSDSARDLTSARATAAGPDKLIDAADQVARSLRGKAGESLRRVQNTPALARVTTSSFEALRKYSEATRLNDIESNYRAAIPLLREAVAIDSMFAEGWRKLAVALGNAGMPVAQSDSALSRAYGLRDRLSERERDIITASWFRFGAHRDRARALAVYDAMLARGDSDVIALNNLALELLGRREYARSETLYRAALRGQPDAQVMNEGVYNALLWQGNLAAADSSLRATCERLPNATRFRRHAVELLGWQGRLEEMQGALDSARKTRDPDAPNWALNQSVDLAADRGRLTEFRALIPEAAQGSGLLQAIAVLQIAGMFRLPIDAALKALDAALVEAPIEQLPVNARPHTFLANTLAQARLPERARAMLTRYANEEKDTVVLRLRRPGLDLAEARVARAEGRWAESVAAWRRSDQLPDGPRVRCSYCVSFDVIETFAEAGMADSALAEYEAYRAKGIGARNRVGPDLVLGAPRSERIAQLYDARGDTAKAVEHYRDFIELWKDADPELQPRVKAARDRLRLLSPADRP